MRMPQPKFLREMGMSSILAGVIMLGMAWVQQTWRRVR